MLWEDNQCLVHYGIIGQHWGIRRYQNKDGSLTPEGKIHYGVGEEKGDRKTERQYWRENRKMQRLLKKTDVEFQNAVANKYKQKATEARNTALVSAAISGAGKTGSVALKISNALNSIDNPEAVFSKDYYNKEVAASASGKVGEVAKKVMWSSVAYNAYAHARAHVAKNLAKDGKNRDKAIEKAKEQYEKMKKEFADTPYASLLNDPKLPKGNEEKAVPTANQKKSIGQRIKDHFEEIAYPPELRGKSKEEKKAWEEREQKKFDAYVEKEKAEREFGKKLNKFDKLDENEQQAVRNEVQTRIDKLSAKKNLTHDETKEFDGLADWYMQDSDKRTKKVMKPLEDAFERAHMNQDDGQVNLHNDPKYKALYKHVLESTKDTSDANWETASVAIKENGGWNSRTNSMNKKPTREGFVSNIKSAEANFKYWENVSESTLKYVKEHFKPEERDRALAFILWNLYD